MKSQMRRKTSLLSRVSTLAVMAAAGTLSVVHQAQADCGGAANTFDIPGEGTTVNVNSTCATVSADVEGDVINDAQVGDPGAGFIPFDVYNNIVGRLINDGNIFGAAAGDGALTIRQGATITNGIENNGVILSTTGNGIQIGDGGENEGYIQNGITNTNNVASGSGYGIAALNGTLTGGLTNQFDEQASTISGGPAAVYIADTFTSWAGGIHNFGQISGTDSAIRMGDSDDDGAIAYSGGIHNYASGVIDSANGPAIIITNDVTTFTGGIQNDNDITGGTSAIVIQADSFEGGVLNSVFASIVAESGDAVQASTGSWSGDFDNQGIITASGNGFSFFAGKGSTFDGSVLNSGQLSAGFSGIIIGVQTFNGDVNNAGQITATSGQGLAISASDIAGSGGETPAQITNTGVIDAAFIGLSISGDNVQANFTNTSSDPLLFPPGEISSESAAAVVLVASTLWQGDVTNDGLLTGVRGMVINGFSDGFAVFSSGGDYEGAITNTGSMTGSLTGLYITGSDVDVTGGGLDNSGLLQGGTAGLIVAVDTWSGDITNAASGSIIGGDTGALISATTFTGNFVNNGVITGGGLDTGLHILATTYNGNIVNNGELSAPSNALHVQISSALNGSIVNTGSIEATIPGSTAVQLQIANGALFINSGGGLVLGDIVFGGKAAYDFVGEDGGVEGRLLGQDDGFGGNDDTITVQNGTQYFFFEGKTTAISNFAAFTVEDGGVAVLGARSVGDTSGSSQFNVTGLDSLTVNGGGTLYLDKSATVNVDTYTQDANGTLMFYLGAPGGEGFSDLTGTVVAGAGDYGQILVTGTATLDGTIAAFLDPTFGSANPGLTEVQYNDVLVAQGGIEGDFDFTALISNNSLFELSSIIDENTLDLRVLRAPLGEVATVSNIVNTGDPFDANIADRTNGIGGGCGVSGAGWCRNRYAAAEPGATQVMTDATPGEDPFAWLRTGTRRVGETAAWGRGIGSWGETDGEALIPGSEYSLGGVIVGADHVFTQTLLAGAAVQWTTTDVEFGAASGDAEVDSLEVGAYASLGDPRLYLNANVSYIWHDFEVNRVVGLNRATGDYDGDTISAYLEAGKTFETDGGLRIQPLLAASYAHLETDAYSETGTGTLLNVLEADVDSLKSIVGARGAYPFALESGRRLVTELRVAWAHEFLDDHSSHFSDVQGGPFNPQLVTGEEFARDTIILGTGATAPLSEATTLFVDYDAGLNEDITTHTVSAGFRTRW